MCVAPDNAQRGGIDEVDVPVYEFSKGRLGAFLRVKQQQLAIIFHPLNKYPPV